MTVSAVSRISACLLSLVILSAALAPLALGAIGQWTTVNSPLNEPQPSVITSGSDLIYDLYVIIQVDSAADPSVLAVGTNLYHIHLTLPASYPLLYAFPYPQDCNIVPFQSSPDAWGWTYPAWNQLPSGVNVDLSVDQYDVLSGTLLQSDHHSWSVGQPSPPIFGVNSAFPSNVSGNNKYILGIDFYIPDSISVVRPSSYSSYYGNLYADHGLVNWSVAPPETFIYRSHLTEPVYDPQNLYFIESSQEGFGKLYWLSIYSVQFQNLSTQNGSLGSESSLYWESVSGPLITNVFVPTITYTEDHGTTCMIYIDPQLDPYHLTNFVCRFDLTFSVFDLETGQLLDCVRIADDTTNVLYNLVLDSYFISSSQIESCKSYGFCFRNLDQRLVNLSSVIWGVDPVVENWRQNIFDLVSDIRDAIVGEDQELETVTVPVYVDDVQAAEETLYNGMAAITDQSGDSILLGGGGRLFDSLEFGEGILTPLQFFRDFYDDFIEPHSEIVFLLTFLLIASVIVAFLGKHIKL